MVQPLKPSRISEEIAHQIRARVLSEELKPDDKLPSEHELATMFRASRSTVREALRSLETSGVVVIKRGARGGPYVASRGLEGLGRSLSDALRARGTPVEQVTEARLLVEPALARLAAERARPADLEAIADTLAAVRARLDSGANPVLGNLEFHRFVARASGNGVLVVILDASLAILEDVVDRLAIDRPMVEGMLRAHETIYDAIRRRRPAKAFRLMTEHVQEAHRGLSRACPF